MAGAIQTSEPPRAVVLRPGIGVTGWVRNRRFDLSLIGGCTLLAMIIALLAGGRISDSPEDRAFIAALLLIDLQLFGGHHVIATYTRLAFDTESLKRHWFLVFVLPLLLLPSVVGAYFLWGLGPIITLYVYWQWFHYMRQSYGLERMYWRKAGSFGNPWLHSGLLYGVATTGMAWRSFQRPLTFLGFDNVWWAPIPLAVVIGLAGVTALLLAVWLFNVVRDWRQGKLRLAHTMFLASHVLVFTVAYIGLTDATSGWLTVNIWHTTQYLMIVWLFNTNRFKEGVNPRHKFMSTLSQPQHLWLYLMVCMAITCLFYLVIPELGKGMPSGGLIAPVIMIVLLSQVVNFHHYIVDMYIWKLRKKPVGEKLGLS